MCKPFNILKSTFIIFILLALFNFLYAGITEDYVQYLKYKNPKERTKEEKKYLNHYNESLANKYQKKFFIGLSIGTGIGPNIEFVFLPGHSLIAGLSTVPFLFFHYDIIGIYRIYMKEHTDSYFVDVFFRSVIFDLGPNGGVFPPNTELAQLNIKADIKAIGAHIGRKWIWNNGFFLTLRIGYNFVLAYEFDITPPITALEHDAFTEIISAVFTTDIKLVLGLAF